MAGRIYSNQPNKRGPLTVTVKSRKTGAVDEDATRKLNAANKQRTFRQKVPAKQRTFRQKVTK